MTTSIEDTLDAAYAAELRRRAEEQRQLALHKAEHWHPHDPDYIDDELEGVIHEG